MLPPSWSCSTYRITIMNANNHFENSNQTILFFQPRFGNVETNGKKSRGWQNQDKVYKHHSCIYVHTHSTKASEQAWKFSSLRGQGSFHFSRGTSIKEHLNVYGKLLEGTIAKSTGNTQNIRGNGLCGLCLLNARIE